MHNTLSKWRQMVHVTSHSIIVCYAKNDIPPSVNSANRIRRYSVAKSVNTFVVKERLEQMGTAGVNRWERAW